VASNAVRLHITSEVYSVLSNLIEHFLHRQYPLDATVVKVDIRRFLKRKEILEKIIKQLKPRCDHIL